MKRIITILFVFCMSLIYAEKSYSQNKTRIDVTEKLSIEIPDNYIRKESKSCLIDAENKNNGNIILLKTIETNNFDRNKVKKSMDTLCFNLSNAKIIKKENEKFYQLDKDFVKRYYDTGKYKVLTYTFYTSSYPYCLLFTYNNESELNEINEILGSIRIERGVFDVIMNIPTFMMVVLVSLAMIAMYIVEDYDTPIKYYLIIYAVIFALGFILFESCSLLFKLVFPLFVIIVSYVCRLLAKSGITIEEY